MYSQFFQIVCIAHFSMAVASTPPTNADVLYAVIILCNRKHNVSILLKSNKNFVLLIFNEYLYWTCFCFIMLSFFKIFTYLSLERWVKRKKERERDISHPPTGNPARNPGMHSGLGIRSAASFGLQDSAQPTEPHLNLPQLQGSHIWM